jgi:hypothetical protein
MCRKFYLCSDTNKSISNFRDTIPLNILYYFADSVGKCILNTLYSTILCIVVHIWYVVNSQIQVQCNLLHFPWFSPYKMSLLYMLFYKHYDYTTVRHVFPPGALYTVQWAHCRIPGILYANPRTHGWNPVCQYMVLYTIALHRIPTDLGHCQSKGTERCPNCWKKQGFWLLCLDLLVT